MHPPAPQHKRTLNCLGRHCQWLPFFDALGNHTVHHILHFVVAITLPSDASWQMPHGCSFNGTQKIIGLILLFVVWVRVVQVQVTKKKDGLPSLGCLQNLISEL